jgi:hypothetical protein
MDNIKTLIELMGEQGVAFADGMNAEEMKAVESKFDIRFPPDLKEFLQIKIPISAGFVNWRQGLNSKNDENEIIQRLNWPLDGMLFDIKENKFWLKDWGERPNTFEQQSKIVSENYKKYPKLIPIYYHRYIPSAPLEVENPIFSVYQMDIIYYGYNLSDYFAHELKFSLPVTFKIPKTHKYIEFWSDHID